MKLVAKNRRARFDYDILETIEAGVVLTGQEVKSAREGGMDLRGAYVTFLRGKAILKQSTIAPYRFAGRLLDYNPSRERELLLTTKQLATLEAAAAEKGVTILPLEVRSARYIKILLGIARGRKTIDKRRAIREKEVKKKLRRGDEV